MGDDNKEHFALLTLYETTCGNQKARPIDSVVRQLKAAADRAVPLEALQLRAVPLSKDHRKELHCLCELVKANPFLNTLVLAACELGNTGVLEVVKAIMAQGTLAKLDVSYNLVKSDGLRSLCTLVKSMSSCTQLNISGNAIGKDVPKRVAPMLVGSAVKLRVLIMNECGINGKPLKSLCESLSGNNMLTALSLMDNGMSPTDIELLSKMLAKNQTLTNLELGVNAVKDDGCKYLGDALKVNHAVRRLGLVSAEVTDVGVSWLMEGLKENKTLQSLDLGKNAFGAMGCESIVENASESALVTLRVGGTPIGDIGATHLSNFARACKTLVHIDLRGMKLHLDTLRAFVIALEENPAFCSIATDKEVSSKLRTSSKGKKS